MKRHGLTAVVAFVLGCFVLSSCVGSFSLFNKLAKWNKGATRYKLLNELIFLVISPAYAVCGIVDMFVLNTVEFWSGSNPMAANVGKTVRVKGDDGNVYALKYLDDGYEVTRPEGGKFYFKHDSASDAWFMVDENGERKELFSFNHDGSVKVALPTGGKMDVALDEGGLFELRTALAGTTYFMAAR